MSSPGISAKATGSSSSSAQGDHRAAPLLAVDELSVAFPDPGGGFRPVVCGVSFGLSSGETLGLVGESGSGKSITALALVRLVPPPGRIVGGRVRFRGEDVLNRSDRDMRELRGAGIGFVFQEPSAALNPVLTIGDHVAEALVVHGRAEWPAARARAIDLLGMVRIPDPAARARDFPHQLSGGMRQRAMIAVALACDPPLVVADEPTTALDATVQAEILDLLDDLQQSRGLALLLISHDLGIVAGRADRVAVMYAGRIVEQAPVREIFATPRHPYTQALLASIPGGSSGTRLPVIEGSAPAAGAMPRGCAFEPRCPARLEGCRLATPEIARVAPAHEVACFLHADTRDAAR